MDMTAEVREYLRRASNHAAGSENVIKNQSAKTGGYLYRQHEELVPRLIHTATQIPAGWSQLTSQGVCCTSQFYWRHHSWILPDTF